MLKDVITLIVGEGLAPIPLLSLVRLEKYSVNPKMHFSIKRVGGLISWTYSFRSLEGNFYPSNDSFARIFTPKRNSSFQRGKNSPVDGLPRFTGSNSKISSRLLGNAYFAMTGYPIISLCPLKKHAQL